MAHLTEYGAWAAERARADARAARRAHDARTPDERTRDAIMRVAVVLAAAALVAVIVWRP